MKNVYISYRDSSVGSKLLDYTDASDAVQTMVMGAGIIDTGNHIDLLVSSIRGKKYKELSGALN